MLKQYRHQRFFSGLFFRSFLVFLGVFLAADVMAGGTASLSLESINKSLSSGVGSLVKLMQDIATVAGIGFIFSAFFKFHQHKMQPTQVPLSQGITMLLIGAGLTVFPHLLNTTSQAVFGQSISKVGSSAISKVVTSSAT